MQEICKIPAEFEISGFTCEPPIIVFTDEMHKPATLSAINLPPFWSVEFTGFSVTFLHHFSCVSRLGFVMGFFHCLYFLCRLLFLPPFISHCFVPAAWLQQVTSAQINCEQNE